MHAILCDRLGDPSVLKLVELPNPTPKAGEIVVRVRAAALNFQTARRRADGRTITYRFAHFFRFKDDKVIETITIIDSFNAAEQVLGHALPIDSASAVTPPDALAGEVNDLVFL